jgi:protein gp37
MNVKIYDKVWNPVRGCSRPFVIFHNYDVASWTGSVELVESRLLDPLRWRKPRRIFVNSMSDLFHESLPFSDIDKIITTMVGAPQHTYQILTKRPKRMLEYFRSGRHDDGWGPDRATYHLEEKIWIGVSVEDQNTADERIPLLLQVPAEVRFVSYEPALGPVYFTPWLHRLDWLIIGGESGPGARPFDVAWAESAIEQAKAAGVPVFMKQFGKDPREGNVNGNCGNFECTHPSCGYIRWKLKHRKGGDPSEWPEWARVREFPR